MSKCIQPIYLKKQNRLVPCGRCWFCMSRKRAEWDGRILLEASTSFSVWFLTLTYDEQHLEYSPLGFPTLNKRTLQNYFKSLRNQGFKFSYFAIGEYGGRFMRPHFHVIYFSNDPDFYPTKLLNTWKYGFVKILPLYPSGIHYVTKFHVYPKDRSIFQSMAPPFSLMSKGIGLTWLAEHYFFERPQTLLIGRYRYPFPRYFSKKLEFDNSNYVFEFPILQNGDILALQKLREFSEKKLNNYKIHSNVNIH